MRPFFSAPIAAQLQQCLLHQLPWDLAFRGPEGSQEVRHQQLLTMAPDESARLSRSVAETARKGFGFSYDRYGMISAYKENRNPQLPLHTLVELLNSPEFIAFARELTGFDDIRKIDAQATRFRPGQFLKAHDDSGHEDGSLRRAAYVISLSAEWQADWGGLLHFIEPNGDVSDTFVPVFNTLNVFRTPQMHEVSYVAPHALQPRISITGWMRAD